MEHSLILFLTIFKRIKWSPFLNTFVIFKSIILRLFTFIHLFRSLFSSPYFYFTILFYFLQLFVSLFLAFVNSSLIVVILFCYSFLFSLFFFNFLLLYLLLSISYKTKDFLFYAFVIHPPILRCALASFHRTLLHSSNIPVLHWSIIKTICVQMEFIISISLRLYNTLNVTLTFYFLFKSLYFLLTFF